MPAPMKREYRLILFVGIVIAVIFIFFTLRQAFHLGRNASPTQRIVII